MPEKDVSWNSMISGCGLLGFWGYGLEVFKEMQNFGVRPSNFTFSILTTFVSCASQGKEIHGNMIRNGVGFSNLVIGNSLIDMYGKLGLIEYALFDQMRLAGYSPDEFTVSNVIAVCTHLRNLVKGRQIFALCIKVGFISNSIVSSALIDFFSKCNILEDSVQLFEEVEHWDSLLCNSMISSYARHGSQDDALLLFVLAMRENCRPTEFTLSLQQVLTFLRFLKCLMLSFSLKGVAHLLVKNDNQNMDSNLFRKTLITGLLSMLQGEELINIASAAALSNDDTVLEQCKNLAINALDIRPVVGKVGRCQFIKGEDILVKGQAHGGVQSIQLDGTDRLCVYSAIDMGYKMARS
ncbi:hypothetical protein CRYUN_Cryun27aG0037400 [Craigia yunnanensis]